jgi:ribosomal protein L30/L7E
MLQRIDRLAHEANLRRINHAVVHTDRPYLEAIEAYLGFRGANVFARR